MQVQFRTKNGTVGTTNWFEVATREWTTSQLGGYVTQSSLNTTLANYATLNGIQTFTNENTFNQSPVIPFGTLASHAVNLGQLADYVDNNNAGILDYVSVNYIPTSHVVNGITSTNINNWNNAFSWGNHATAGYTNQSWVQSQNYATNNFVEERINELIGEFVDHSSFSIKNEFTTVVLTENYSKEPVELEGELVPGRYISIINLTDSKIELTRDHNTIDIIYENETSEYYITKESRLVKKGTYKSAKKLI